MLSAETINKIAAGEVIVRPVSVVKELVENAIDAGATKIAVKLIAGGKLLISVKDNGCGIPYKEVPLAFKRHATSKLIKLEDLDILSSLGFRGEALSSVAAVSKVTVVTRSEEEEMGSISDFADGQMLDQRVCAYSRGTEIRIEELFYNTPARKKHLAKDQKEELLIRDLMQKLSLSHPEIAFRLIARDKSILDTTGADSLLQVISLQYGEMLTKNLVSLNYENQPMVLTGYIGNLQTMRSSREDQIFFINRRFVKSRALSEAFEEAYSGYLMKNNYPFGIIFLDLPSRMLDVNIHPAKTEIKILNESLIKILFKQGIREHLKKANLVVDVAEVAESEPQIKTEAKPQLLQNNFFEQAGTESQTKIAVEPQLEKKLFFVQSSADQPITLDQPTITDQPDSLEDLQTENAEKPISQAVSHFSETDRIAEKNRLYEKTDRQSDFAKISQSISEAAPRPESPQAKSRLPRPDFTKMKLIGQLFNVYILLQFQDQVFLIDQHAAHEAFLTAELEKIFADTSAIPAQQLLTPLPLKFRPKDRKAIEDNLDLFRKIGYEAESFGQDCLLVRSVPILLGEELDLSFLEAFIQDYAGSGFSKWDDSHPLTGQIKSRLITMACKAAIKGGQVLSDEEIKILLNRLMALDNPFTCPHGRPIILRLKEYELMKLFKRVV
ncbi:DNA mismatch repair endonuclease MutL [Eubacteriaceae bacterium ES2]|nr:DNA mismatch repair endonuclease MutL [Eubacteriaceae bacterium ES2]